MKKMWIIAALVTALLLTGITMAEAAEVGKAAPDFSLETLDGETFTLSEQKGKVVYLNSRATWCPPCVYEIPDIQKLYEAHGDQFAVIGVSVDDEVSEVRRFVTAKGLGYAVAMDEDYRLCTSLYPTNSIPLSVFIDPEGVVTAVHSGMLFYEAMEAEFNKALGAQGDH